MKKQCMVLMFMALVSAVCGQEWEDILREYGFVDAVSISSESLTLTFSSPVHWAGATDSRIASEELEYRRAQLRIREEQGFPATNAVSVLRANHEVAFGNDSFTTFRLMPVVFKNQLKGYRVTQIVRCSVNDPRGRGAFICDIRYIVLSDTPIEVGDADVERIMEGSTWKTLRELDPYPIHITPFEEIYVEIMEKREAYERNMKEWRENNEKAREAWEKAQSEKAAAITPEAEPEPPPVIASEAKQSAPEPGQGSDKAFASRPQHRLWLYVVGGVLLCAVLGLSLKKREAG